MSLTGLDKDNGAARLPSPLPADPTDALLTEMLAPAPYEVPTKKAKKKATGTRKGLRRKVVLDSLSDDFDAHSSHENEEEKEESSPPSRGDKKRKADPTGEAEGSKKGSTLPPDYSATAAYSGDKWLPRDKPLAKL